jgi:hypothetical protein
VHSTTQLYIPEELCTQQHSFTSQKNCAFNNTALHPRRTVHSITQLYIPEELHIQQHSFTSQKNCFFSSTTVRPSNLPEIA